VRERFQHADGRELSNNHHIRRDSLLGDAVCVNWLL
jgi:hypothetical protein